MISSSKLNFAAWTGLGITALFGGTGIYLVRNSQNLGRGVGKNKEVSDRVSSSELDPALEPVLVSEEEQATEDNKEQDSEPENADISQESDLEQDLEQDSEPEIASPELVSDSEPAEEIQEEQGDAADADPFPTKDTEDLPQTQPQKENLDQNPVSPQDGRRDFIFHEEDETFEEVTQS